MRKSAREIYLKFNGKLVGNRMMKFFVCETLALMPSDIVDYVTKNCWFLASVDDAWAFTFTGNDLANQHLVFLSDHLLIQDAYQIQYTIAHEIGHVMLGHRNSVLVRQSKSEIRKQEKEADEFVKKYFPDG